MIETMTSVALLAAVSLGPIARVGPGIDAPDTLAGAARAVLMLPDVHRAGPAPRQQAAKSNDSLKNGAIVGAIAGGLTVGVLAATGCAAGGALGVGESDCGGPVLVGMAIGAGLGALIGVGVDALFQRVPQTGRDPRGVRKGLQVRLRF